MEHPKQLDAVLVRGKKSLTQFINERQGMHSWYDDNEDELHKSSPIQIEKKEDQTDEKPRPQLMFDKAKKIEKKVESSDEETESESEEITSDGEVIKKYEEEEDEDEVDPDYKLTDKDIIASRSFKSQDEAIKYFGNRSTFKAFLEKMWPRLGHFSKLLEAKGILKKGGDDFTNKIRKQYKFFCSDDGFQYFLDYLRTLTDEDYEKIKKADVDTIMKTYILEGDYTKEEEGFLYYLLDDDLLNFWNDI